MELPAIGDGRQSTGVSLVEDAPSLEPVASHPASSRSVSAHTPADANATIFANIAERDIPKLMAILEPARLPQTASLVRNLFNDTVVAVAQGDSARAVANLSQAAMLDPTRLEGLRVDPAYASIRPQLERVLHQVTAAARIDAEASLARAVQLLQSAGEKPLPNWETRPEILMQAAHRLFNAGGYANYIYSAQLAQAIVDFTPWIVNSAPVRTAKTVDRDVVPESAVRAALRETWAAIRKQAPPKFRALWHRAPLLVLFLAWLALGLIAGPVSIVVRTVWPGVWPECFYNVWAIGFLVLTGFGFYARVRSERS